MNSSTHGEGPAESPPREEMLQRLVHTFIREGYTVKGVKGLEGFDSPTAIRNHGFGSRQDRTPDVVGFDGARRRIVFGLVRGDRKSLDSGAYAMGIAIGQGLIK